MNAAEYRKALEALELTQEGAAALVGVAGRTGRRWATGERTIPPPMAKLMRLLVERPELLSVLKDLK